MTDLNLDWIEALCNAATPGPWRRVVNDGAPSAWVASDDNVLELSVGYLGNARVSENADFIAGTGPDVVKELVRQLREAREERDKATRAVQTYSRVIEQQCTDVLNATGAHHLIQEDGDGDWMGVWEIMHELCQKGKAADG